MASKKEAFQTIGAIAGLAAFVGMVVMYFMNQATFEELVTKNNAAHKAINKDVADITVDYGPSDVFGGILDALWGPWGAFALAVVVIVLLVKKNKKLSSR